MIIYNEIMMFLELTQLGLSKNDEKVSKHFPALFKWMLKMTKQIGIKETDKKMQEEFTKVIESSPKRMYIDDVFEKDVEEI